MRLSNRQSSAVLMISSAFFFTCMQISVRLTGTGVPLMQQVLIRSLASLLLCYFILRRRRVSLFGSRQYQLPLFARSLIGFFGAVFQFAASQTGAQASITVFIRMSPFITTIVAYFFLRERITRAQVAALFIAFLGGFLVANPFGSDIASMYPMLMALLCAVCTGVIYPLLSYLSDKVDSFTTIMHFSIVSTACSLFVLILQGGFVIPHGSSLFIFLLVSVFACLGQICLTFAFHFAPASEVSIYNYTAIPFSAILGFVVLGEHIALHAMVGGTLVICAAMIVYCSGRRAELAQRRPVPHQLNL